MDQIKLNPLAQPGLSLVVLHLGGLSLSRRNPMMLCGLFHGVMGLILPVVSSNSTSRLTLHAQVVAVACANKKYYRTFGWFALKFL